jgi:hypothetical protein
MELDKSTTLLPRDHLFISYAWEDQQFARWLALRLTAEGYKVWFDQIKLLGGESWPRDIDVAIKTRTFRMLGLLSKFSIAKPNPLKERTLALNIAKQPGRQGFLIPLNVDGMSATDLDWLTSDITFISFDSSWAKGLAQLLKLLERERCPKGDGDGRAIVARITASHESIVASQNQLTSNACPFVQVPSQVMAFRVSPSLSDTARHDVQRDWACYPVSPHRVLAFHPPGEQLLHWLHAELAQSYEWRMVDEIEGIESQNVVVRLLRGCIETRLRLLGFSWSSAAEAFAFPGAIGEDVRLLLPNGKKTTVQHSGERTFFRVGQPKTRYRYRLAVNLSIERDFFSEFSLIWRLRFHLTDTNDTPLAENQRQSRRKHLTRAWFNQEWFNRHLATIQSCTDTDGMIRIGLPGDGEVVLDCHPNSFCVERDIDESKLTPPEEISDEVPADEDLPQDVMEDEDHDH